MSTSAIGESMSYLQAHRIVSGFAGGEALPFLLAMSGNPDKLDLFIQAAAAKRNRRADVRRIAFNTLGQALLAEQRAGVPELFVLLPWDFVAEADWRSGIPALSADANQMMANAQTVAAQLARRSPAGILYLPAMLPPILADDQAIASLERGLLAIAQSLGAQVLPAEAFSLGSYLLNGSPCSGLHLGVVAEAIVDVLVGPIREPSKVLITDLDNVMWAGVIGEDGPDGIQYNPEGMGFRHFLYQTLLSRLKSEGTLLAAVSRNDPDLARLPFTSGKMVLTENDFVCISASYDAKSAAIAEIAARLNLGLESFVFVDDNPIEIAEVTSLLPAVQCVPFPTADDQVPAFLRRLSRCFSRKTITAEDRSRTDMYRRRLDGMARPQAHGADLTSFLRELDMRLLIHDRSSGDRTRAVQLINKTNQFNLNGRRFSDEEVAATLEAGGRLFGATLNDRTGTHGEILACLVSAEGVVQAFVLSCRVFERRVEHAFMTWLATQANPPRALHYTATPRNEPFRKFLQDPPFHIESDGTVAFPAGDFAKRHGPDLSLFSVEAD